MAGFIIHWDISNLKNVNTKIINEAVPRKWYGFYSSVNKLIEFEINETRSFQHLYPTFLSLFFDKSVLLSAAPFYRIEGGKVKVRWENAAVVNDSLFVTQPTHIQLSNCLSRCF